MCIPFDEYLLQDDYVIYIYMEPRKCFVLPLFTSRLRLCGNMAIDRMWIMFTHSPANKGWHTFQLWLAPSGSVAAVKQCLKRHRNSMQQILQLDQLPDQSLDENERAQMQMLRNEPMEGERHMIWAIQSGSDEQTRQALPSWMCEPIRRYTAKWLEEHKSWQLKISRRAAEGKNLTERMQKLYTDWQEEKKTIRLLFNKVKQCEVTTVRKNADVARMRRELFSIDIEMSPEASLVKLKAGGGNSFKLVVLLGAAQPGIENENAVPSSLDQGLAEGALRSVDQAEEALLADSDEEMEAKDGFLDEQEALVTEAAALEGSGHEEVLGFSSEEEELRNLVPPGYVRVKAFHHRPAYCKLEALGLVALPPGGIHISYHSGSRTWSGYHPDKGSKELCYTHSGTTRRTEAEALLLVIRGLLKLYMDKHPRDGMWRLQHDRVVEALATEAYL